MSARPGTRPGDEAAVAGGPGPSLLCVLEEARRPVAPREHRRVYRAVREIAVLAILDAIERPDSTGATCAAARAFLADADAAALGALVEPIRPREAHAVIAGLSRTGLISPQVAQITHARIDLRAGIETSRR